MGKIIGIGSEAKKKILSGVEKLAQVVSLTLGPGGRNVILSKHVGSPTVTKDGVSVAREVVLEDPIENQGCLLVKEASGRTCDVAGDGTTSSIVLSYEILKRGIDLIESGYNVLDFRVGVDWASKKIIENLDSLSTPVDNPKILTHIATISANNDPDLGGKIAEAYSLVGSEGMVSAEAIPGVENSVREVSGIEIKSGYLTAGFLEKDQEKCLLENCRILICNREITNIEDNLKLFNDLANQHKNLLIICKDLNKEALKTLLGNHKLGRVRVCAIKIPVFGLKNEEWLEDLSLLTNTIIVDEEKGVPLSEMTVDKLGFAANVEVGKYLTKISGPRKNEKRIADKIETYRNDENVLRIGDFERKDIRDRMKFLSSRAAIITVGYSTELELREKGDRVDDATSAVRAAMEEGVVPGGGCALLRSAQMVDLSELDPRYHPAAKVVLESCKKPAIQILENARMNSSEILEKILENKDVYFGYNSATFEFGNLMEMGIIDPKKVAKTALKNSISIAYLLITSEAIIVDNPENPAGWQTPAGYRLPEDGKLNHKY